MIQKFHCIIRQKRDQITVCNTVNISEEILSKGHRLNLVYKQINSPYICDQFASDRQALKPTINLANIIKEKTCEPQKHATNSQTNK